MVSLHENMLALARANRTYKYKFSKIGSQRIVRSPQTCVAMYVIDPLVTDVIP
jgi:hypothetical protein